MTDERETLCNDRRCSLATMHVQGAPECWFATTHPEVVERVRDWLSGMRVDRPIELTNQRYADMWRLLDAAARSERPALFDALKHGDHEHQDWLREAIDAHFDGKPVPAPRGAGNKEKRIAELEAEVARLSERPAVESDVLTVGAAVRCLADNCPHEWREDWRDWTGFVAGVHYEPRVGLNYTVCDTWPPANHGDLSDGFREGHLTAIGKLDREGDGGRTS